MGTGHSGVQGWGAAAEQSHYHSSGVVKLPGEAAAPCIASRLARRRILHCFLTCVCPFDLQGGGLRPITDEVLNRKMNS